MTRVDLSPLFRTAIGFDRLARLVDNAASAPDAQTYPPYNIEKTGAETYRLTLAVAGFRPEEIDVTVRDNTLFVSGRVAQEGKQAEMLHRGIAGRAFERRFVLADHIVVESANLEHGLLYVDVRRVVPEALKPRKIAIGSAAPTAPVSIANDKQASAQAA